MHTIQFNDALVSPSKVVCVARNYLIHIKELGNTVPEQAVFFIKPNSAISHDLVLPADGIVSYEAEIAFLIRDNVIFGVGFGLDLTKRDVQAALKTKGLPWERAKSFDGAAVLSPFVPFNGDITGLSLRLSINGDVVQDGRVVDMIDSPTVLLAEANTFLSFEDNDVLMTGTPEGVGLVKAGARFLGQIFQGDVLVVEQDWLVGTAV